MRAWNDWHLDEWVGPRTDRFIPLQLPWLSDPEVAAAEVRRNAERGFQAVSFLEQPVDMGLPSLHTDHWDPFLRACEETGTVVCLHCASSGWSASRSPYAPLELLTTLFPVNALVTCADWLWSGVPVRFPGLRICLAESGIDWVPMLINRIDYVMDHSASGLSSWGDPERHPTEVLRQAFWFGVIDLTSSLVLRDEIGVEHIVLESDYPHADSTWPDTSTRAALALASLPPEEADAICWANASRLFDFPVPDFAATTRGSVHTMTTTARYVRPEVRSANPYSDEVAADPIPFYEALRDHGPHRLDAGDAAHAPHQPLRGREVRPPAPGDLQLRHLRGRHRAGTAAAAVADRPARPRQVPPGDGSAPERRATSCRSTRRCGRLVNELIDAFVERGSCDFHAELTVPLPCTVFLELCDLPLDQLDPMLGWKDDIIRPQLRHPEARRSRGGRADPPADRHWPSTTSSARSSPTGGRGLATTCSAASPTARSTASA